MLCPNVFPSLATVSALSTQPPPSPLLSATPGLVCDIAPPFKFGWQVFKPPVRSLTAFNNPFLRLFQPPSSLPKENELLQVVKHFLTFCIVFALIYRTFALHTLMHRRAGMAGTNPATSRLGTWRRRMRCSRCRRRSPCPSLYSVARNISRHGRRPSLQASQRLRHSSLLQVPPPPPRILHL